MILRLRLLHARARRETPADSFDRAATSVARLGALVGAGALPAVAWRYLAERVDDPVERASILRARGGHADEAAAAAGAELDDAWRRVGLVVALADDVGAPLARTLSAASAGLRDAAALHRAVAVALAGPAASARVMLWTPIGALLVAWAFGFDIPAVLASIVGAVAAGIGALLLVAARGWTGRLVRAASDVPWQRGLGVELVGIGVRAGLPTAAARARADEFATGAGFALSSDDAAIDDVVDFAADAGVPLAALLDAEAQHIRSATLAEASGRSAALGAKLLLPLACCILPAFLLLGVLPVALAVLSSTTLRF